MENNENISNKEKRELEQENKKREYERQIKLKKLKKSLPWILFIGLLVFIFTWVISENKKEQAVTIGNKVEIVGRDHIDIDKEQTTYNSNPPTSGAHGESLPWGFYEEEIKDGNAVHNLEHGGIWISYKDLNGTEIDKLRVIAKNNPGSVIVSPRASNDSKVAVASWGRLLKMETIDEDKIREYIRKNKNKSPERLAR